MCVQAFLDLVHELIVVDSEDGLLKGTYENNGIIYVSLNDGSKFEVKISEAA